MIFSGLCSSVALHYMIGRYLNPGDVNMYNQQKKLNMAAVFQAMSSFKILLAKIHNYYKIRLTFGQREFARFLLLSMPSSSSSDFFMLRYFTKLNHIATV